MIETDPHLSPAAPRMLSRALVEFLATAAVLLIAVLVGAQIAYGVPTATVLAGAVLIAIVVLALRGFAQGFPHPHIGACNIVTLVRAAIIAGLAGAILVPAPNAAALSVAALIALSLDGLDGWLARRNHTASTFGARLDMETDALLGAVLSLILLQSAQFGPEILLLGILRYVFLVAALAFPWLSAPLPESLRRKTICVVQMAALIFCLAPWTPQALLMPVALTAIALLIWSFALDVMRLYVQR